MFQVDGVSAAERIGAQTLIGEDAVLADELVGAARTAFGVMPDSYEEAVARFSMIYPSVARAIVGGGKMDLVRDALRVAVRGDDVVSHMIFGLSLMMMCREAGLFANASPIPFPSYEDPQGVMKFSPSRVIAMGATNMVGPVAISGIPAFPICRC